jgi:hypothetical protein
MSDFTSTVDEGADLAFGLGRDTRYLTGKFRCNNLGGGDFPLVKPLQLFYVSFSQTVAIAENPAYGEASF